MRCSRGSTGKVEYGMGRHGSDEGRRRQSLGKLRESVVESASCIAMGKIHRAGSAVSCTSWASDETRISIEAWRMEGETWRNANLELGKFR